MIYKSFVLLIIILILLSVIPGCGMKKSESEIQDEKDNTVLEESYKVDFPRDMSLQIEEKTDNDGNKDDLVNLSYLFRFPAEEKGTKIAVDGYPSICTYCKISASEGSVTPKHMRLDTDDGRTFFYTLQEGKEMMYDTIVVDFYDDTQRLIVTKEISVEYNSEEHAYF